LSLGSCYNCQYLSKKPGVKNYFVYKCEYWGLVCQGVLPQSVVISSIGKKCPFFKEKLTKPKNSATNKNENNNSNLNIVV